MNYNPSNPFGIFIDWRKALGYSRCGLCAKREKCDILDLYGECQDFEMTKNEITSVVTDSGEVLYSKHKKNCDHCNLYYNCVERLNRSMFCNNYNFVQPRCDKCVYNFPTCNDEDWHGECKTYKRDPPDGGYYG